jgi:threonine synthase
VEHLGVFSAARFDDDQTLAQMASMYADDGMLIDPHTAIGVAAARACRVDSSVPMVALATAHPAKFPDAVEQATGVRPALPAHLADLLSRPERSVALPNDLVAIERYITSVTG